MSYWSAALDVASAASSSYTACIRSAGQSCQALYNATLSQLVSEQAATIAANNNLTAAAVSHTQHCRAVSAAAVSLAQAWLAAGAVLSYKSEVCSDVDIERTRLLLGDRSSEAASGSSSSQVFAANSTRLMAAASLSVANRVTYDLSYIASKVSALSLHVSLLAAIVDPFPSVRLSASLADLDDSVSAVLDCVWGSSGSSLCAASLASLYQPVLDGLQVSLAAAQDGFSSLLAQAAVFSSTALSQLQVASSFIDYLRGFTSLLSSIGVSVDLPSLSALPPFAFTGGLSVEESVAVVDRAADSFARLMSPAAVAFQSAIDSVRSEALSDAELLVSQISNLTLDLPALFADFDPPPVDLQLASFDLQLDQAADSFVAQSKALFSSLSSPSSNASVQLELDDQSDDNSADSDGSSTTDFSPSALLANLTSTVNRSNFTLELLPFSGSFPIDSVLDTCAGVLGALLLLDYVFRAYRSVHIIVNAIKRPNMNLPAIDTRLHTVSAASTRNTLTAHVPASLSHMRRDATVLWQRCLLRSPSALVAVSQDSTTAPASDFLAYLVTHPSLLYAAVCVVVGLSLYPLALLYSYLYEEYVSGCVQSSNGTLLTINANALLFNAAGLEGHAVLLATVAAYDARAAVDCARFNGVGVADYLNDELAIAEARAHEQSADDSLALISRCLSPLPFTVSMLPPTSSPSSVSFSLPSPFVLLSADVLAECSSRTEYAAELQLPVMNCSALPSCSLLACVGGPSPDAIAAATFDSGCATEYALHSSLLLYSVALLVFICHNVSRVLIVRAVTRMCWHSLSPHGLTALVAVGENGVLDVQSSDRLLFTIRDAVVKYRRQTLWLFLCGLLAHVPYFVVLGVLLYVDKGIEAPHMQ